MKLKKDKESGLENHIKIKYKGFVQVEAKSTRYNNVMKKTIPEL